MPVYKDKERGTYFVQTRYTDINGDYKYLKKRGFATSKEAKEYERLEIRKAKIKITNVIRFDDLCMEFLIYKDSRVKSRTIKDNASRIENKMKPYFKNKFVDTITTEDVVGFQNFLLEKDYSNNYLKALQSLLSGIFKFAVRNMYIERNPFDYIEYVKNMNKPEEEMKFWTYEEYLKFRSVVDDFYYQCLFDTLYYSGMRIGELQARKWSDIDFNNSTLFINTNWDNHNQTLTNSTKTGVSRKIYLNKSVVEELKTLYSKNQPNKEHFIFGDLKPPGRTTITKHKNDYIKEYNTSHDDKIEQIRLHDFRHSHVSLLANKGLDSFTIAERLGHSKDMVEKRYSHMFPEKRKQVLDILDNL